MGTLNRGHHPIKTKQGKTFNKFVSQLQDLGYEVQFRELVAADYGAPTMRKRFFMVARCDKRPIIWPEPTHAPADSEAVKKGLLKPYVGAYTQIDFSRPCPSIFDTSEQIKEKYGIKAVRPLAPKTMERIARGLKKFVLDNPEPFIVQCNHGGDRRPLDTKEPLPTITGKHGYGIVEPTLAPYMGTNTTNHPGGNCRNPIHTITTGNQQCLISPILIQYHSETNQGEVRGQTIDNPVMTIDGSNRYGLVLSNLIQMNNHCDGRDIKKPLPTITAGDGHFGEVRAFLVKYYGDATGQDIKQPLDTITTKDRFGLVTIKGTEYRIVDIGLRMLEPRELYGCQGFPSDYIIDHDYTGKTYPRAEQVKRCGNSVSPMVPNALVRANLKELCIAQRMPNCSINEEKTGQLRFA
ncbi:DNA cytosine methyltransferase [Lachnospira eligens]|uniref:DNA cytosine methyltransferase n=1 Tax=Lachnospira eligens TaxID=39485 RepID=UPI0020949CAD|nr:DNA cytosine methyltransferase [Lachnospira eligens]